MPGDVGQVLEAEHGGGSLNHVNLIGQTLGASRFECPVHPFGAIGEFFEERVEQLVPLLGRKAVPGK